MRSRNKFELLKTMELLDEIIQFSRVADHMDEKNRGNGDSWVTFHLGVLKELIEKERQEISKKIGYEY
ncbi:MAG: hypothetical protein AABY22_31250 [Nanoarchaeota archaeon]